MTAFDFAQKLAECEKLEQFTPESLAKFWSLSPKNFLWASESSPIQFFALGNHSGNALFLRGAQFFPAKRKTDSHRVIRSHPRILPTSDHTGSRFQIILEQQIYDCLVSGVGDAVVEPKIEGQTIRVYYHGGDLHCATDAAFDGGNPLVGAGIENSRALGIDFGHQAARLVSERYPGIDRLAKLGYVGVFVLSLPETTFTSQLHQSDLILVDVIDPDHQFVDRNEKERIADDFKLNVVNLASNLTLPETSSDAQAFLRLCRALSRQAHQESLAGYVVKVRSDEASDQAFVKIESLSDRDRSREFSGSDLAAVIDEISGQYGDSIWQDTLDAEEIMLEFLGTHHPTAMRQVHKYIESWQAAKASAGIR